jgi:hypothetical protein
MMDGNARAQAALAYVGCVVGRADGEQREAFSPAGNGFQSHLLESMVEAGLTPTAVFSARPAVSWPRGSKVWIRGGVETIGGQLEARIAPCVNVPGLKHLSVGVVTFVRLIQWGWRYRHAPVRVVYSYNVSYPPGLTTWLATRLIGATAVVSVNDLDIPGETIPDGLFRRLDYRLQRALLRRFDALVVVSDRIADLAPHRPSLRMEGGVRKELMCEDALDGEDRERGAFTLGFAGSLDAANGITQMVEAVETLPDEDVRLEIAGSGPLAGYVRKPLSETPASPISASSPLTNCGGSTTARTSC